MIKKEDFVYFSIIGLLTLFGMALSSIALLKISVFILFLLLIVKGLKEKSVLNPFFMFLPVPFSLLIYENISNYHLKLNSLTFLIAIINISAFVLGMSFTKPVKQVKENEDFSTKGYWFHSVFLAVLSLIPNIYLALFRTPFFLASVLYLLAYPALLVALKSKNKLLIALILAIHIVPWFIQVTKMSVLSLALTFIIGYEKYYKKSKEKTIILVIISLFLVIAAFSFANQNRQNNSYNGTVLQYYSQYGGAVWNLDERLFMPYMYLTTPWSNLQYVMTTQNTRTYGLWLVKPFLGYLQLDNYFSNYYYLEAYSSFNTFTYLAVCFKDFGIFGSCLSSLFLGFFTKKVYSRYKVSKSPFDVVCYLLVAQSVFEMFFSNHFFMQSYPFTIVIIMEIYKIIFRKTYNYKKGLVRSKNYANN